jgi:putative FmdB family regulatory protein
VPIYEYKCRNGHVFEAVQRMSDDPLAECEECGAPVERVFHPIAVHFKGSGFYTTDYGSKKKAAAADGAGKEGGKEAAKAAGGDSKSTEPKNGSGETAAAKKD